MTSVASGEYILLPKDHFIILRMLTMDNMEYNKKVCKTLVCKMNLISQINNEIWSPHILQSYHKTSSALTEGLPEKEIHSLVREKALRFFPQTSQIFMTWLLAFTDLIWVAIAFHLLLVNSVLWSYLTATRIKVYCGGNFIKRKPRRLWKDAEIKKGSRRKAEERDAKREKKHLLISAENSLNV